MSDERTMSYPAMPTLEFLLSCSRQTLQSFEMAALNRSAECLKRARIEWDEAVAQREAAGIARWLLNNRGELLQQASRTLEVSTVQQFPGSLTVTGPKKGLDTLLGKKGKDQKGEEG